jgi:signal transduction histidine kinase
VTARRLASALFLVTAALVASSLALDLAAPAAGGEPWWFAVAVGTIALVYTGAGAMIGARRSRNPIGWVLILIGFLQACNAFTTEYSTFRIGRSGVPLPLAAVVGWAGSWTWIPSVGSLGTFLLLLFPSGRLLTRRWRTVAWLAAVGILAAVAGAMIGFWPVRQAALADPEGAAPVGLGAGVMVTGFVLTGVAALLSVVSLVLRFRRASGDERQQLRWFTLAGTVVVLGTFLAFTPIDAASVVLLIGFFLIPIAVAVAILKYRLYELDLIINKAVVYGALAAFVSLVYAGFVVGIGAAIGSTGNALLSAVAAAVVALAFQPVRRWAQRIADRLVYGERATPYEVLSGFADRLSGSYSIDDVLPRLARLVAEGTGASDVGVWLAAGTAFREVAAWPRPTASRAEVPSLEALGEARFEVRHHGETLGAILVSTPANDPLTPEQERLVSAVASQAGLVLRNVRLIEELRASRQRLVRAQDEQRRRIERNIHDGAQQQLVALAVKLRLADQLVERDPGKARALLAELQDQTGETLEDLRDLARGIYPPLLAEEGLAAALQAQARKVPVPIEVASDGVGRYDQEVEAAIYFCVLEALQNVVKYAGASAVRVGLEDDGASLSFRVSDDGTGFDPTATNRGTGLQGMADRVDALGGSLAVVSIPSEGTTVEGTVPIGHPEARR